MPADDATWQVAAEAARAAVDQFGIHYDHCLPGEPDACGMGYVMHAVSYLMTLQEIAAHQLEHAGVTDDTFPGLREGIRERVT